MSTVHNLTSDSPQERKSLFTIGHSALPASRLVELLESHSIDTVVDVRSQPYSRIHPQHNRESLRDVLRSRQIRYAFMGDTLGGRPQDQRHYDEQGHVNYSSWSDSPEFRSGLSRLIRCLDTYRVALLCSEEDPNDCHRHLLIARALLERGWEGSAILHIRAKGRVISEAALAHQLGLDGYSVWRSPQSVLQKVLPDTSSNG